MTKLTVDDVREILCKRIWGWSAQQTADYFNIGKSTVIDIWFGRTWKSANLPTFAKKQVANHNPVVYDDAQWG